MFGVEAPISWELYFVIPQQYKVIINNVWYGVVHVRWVEFNGDHPL